MREKTGHNSVADAQKDLDKVRTPTGKRKPDGSVKLSRHPVRTDENSQARESKEKTPVTPRRK
jgi:hypothetical protein